jgi:hypothetical protein
MSVKQEFTGLRDLGLSMRHRQWGFHCPAVDLDFLLVEYDSGVPRALVEYKHEGSTLVYPSHPSICAVRTLANDAALPFFVVRHAADFAWFDVYPMNERARAFVTERPRRFTEAEWIACLYRVRNREPL